MPTSSSGSRAGGIAFGVLLVAPAVTTLAPGRDMQDVLAEHASFRPKPLESLTPEEARKQPTPADAVQLLLFERVAI